MGNTQKDKSKVKPYSFDVVLNCVNINTHGTHCVNKSTHTENSHCASDAPLSAVISTPCQTVHGTQTLKWKPLIYTIALHTVYVCINWNIDTIQRAQDNIWKGMSPMSSITDKTLVCWPTKVLYGLEDISIGTGQHSQLCPFY